MVEPRKLFEALIQENAQSLRIFLHSALRDPSLIDDIFQETMIVAWRSIERFDQDRSFGKWIRGIARNLILSQRRAAARQIVLNDTDLIGMIDDHCESIQLMSNDFLDDELTRLRKCVDALPATYRDAIKLRYQNEIRGQRLAASLGTSWDNVKKRLQRGRKILFECMEGKWAAARGTT
jgi:RNA polymerase sigma-70 factor (ECF subfamily)